MKRLALLVLCTAAGFPRAHADEAAAMAILRAGCAQDAQRLCAGVQPGGGRVIACLKEHKDTLSDKCKEAAQRVSSMAGGNPPAAAPKPPVPGALPSPDAAPGGVPGTAGAFPAASTGAKAASETSPSAGKHEATADDTSASYLRMKKAQIMIILSDEPNAQPEPSLEMLIPTTWELKGGLIPTKGLKSGCFSDSFPLGLEAKSPDGTRVFQKFAESSWQYSDDPQELRKLNDPNRRAYGGNGKVCPVGKPLTAEQYFRENLMAALPAGTKLISIDAYPELTEIVRQQMGMAPHDAANGARIDAIRAHVEFETDGKPIEAWLTAAVVMRTFPVGRGTFYDMHAVDLMSLTAPKGQLAGNEKLLRVMMSSIRTTPRFSAAINKSIASFYDLQAQKEAKIDQINAKLQNDITQTYRQMSANAARGSRQGFLEADQNIRGVQTFRNPTTGQTMELSNQYDHAWLNGANEYIMSDDPNFNPNAHLSGSWNQLEAVRPSP